MLYVKPDYYDSFVCTADQCEDTCCAGWQILVDQESLDRYHKEKGPFRRQLHRGIHWRKKIFRQDKDKRCAFLNEGNLCDLYSSLGQNALCKVCYTYPRHIEEFEGVRELSLSISCPEVARYLMNRQEAVEFLYEEDDKSESDSDFEDMDFDLLLYDILEEGRNVLQSIFQDRNLSMKERCQRSLHLAADIEENVENGHAFACQDLFENYRQANISYISRHLKKPMEYSKIVISAIFRLERLREEWESLLSESAALLFLQGPEYYSELSEEFIKWQKDNFSLDVAFEQLAVYYVTTYFCGAVYDGRILAKIQSSVLFLYVISELCKARWLKNNKSFDSEDLIEITYRFSRELEHSDQNLDAMEKIARAALPVSPDEISL